GLETRMDGLETRMGGLDGRMHGLDGRMDGLERRVDTLAGDMQDVKQTVYRHEVQLRELTDLTQRTHDKLDDLIKADIKEILDRLAAIEERLPAITEAEVRKLQAEMQAAIDWIEKVSKLKNIPVKFPS
ncbi:MAG TPA: hypothetical protein VIS56_00395, partial [Candidatus Saccharimonadales bacterium]